MLDEIKLFNDIKTLFYVDDKMIDLYYFLKNASKYNEGYVLIITPNQEASKKVFKKMLSQFNKYLIARYVRDGGGYEFVLEDNKRIIIQDVTYLLNCRHHDGIRFKSINFME